MIGIQAALVDRAKTGIGEQVEISLLDCMMGVLANSVVNFLASGEPPARLGNANPNIILYQTFGVLMGILLSDARMTGSFKSYMKRWCCPN